MFSFCLGIYFCNRGVSTTAAQGFADGFAGQARRVGDLDVWVAIVCGCPRDASCESRHSGSFSSFGFPSSFGQTGQGLVPKATSRSSRDCRLAIPIRLRSGIAAVDDLDRRR